MAHAWVEVYLEGFGWMIIEATPTYAFIMESFVPSPNEGGQDSSFDDEWFDEMRDQMRSGEDDDYLDIDWDALNAQSSANYESSGEDDDSAVADVIQDVILFILLIPLVLCIAALIYLITRLLRVKLATKRIKHLDNGQQTLAYFSGIFDIASYYTATPLYEGETLNEYSARKGKRFAFRGDSVFFKDLITLYHKAKYSPHNISSDEKALMEEAYFDMVNLLRTMRWSGMFIWLRYVKRIGVIFPSNI